MKIEYINHTSGSRRLLLLFLGWGMDRHPFEGLAVAGCDLAVAYDYSSEENGAEVEELGVYEEILLVAWSFGVIAADRFLSRHTNLPVTLRLAINGTLYPVDDTYGIPEEIFRGTLAHLSDVTLMKFRRRMCGGASESKRFMANAPVRSIESLRAELISIAAMSASHTRWDEAIVSGRDYIIPAENQRKAWLREGVRMTEIEGAHLPDFSAILSRRIVDKALVARRFAEASATYEKNASVQHECAERLSALWHKHQGGEPVRNVIEVGAGTGLFTRIYRGWLKAGRLALWDIAEVNDSLPGRHEVCDAEVAITKVDAGSVSAVVSASALQWFSSPAGFIRECGRVVERGGLLVLATYGPDNYREIAPSGYPELSQLVKWAEMAGFDTEEAEEHRDILAFDSPRDLLEHMRLTGVNARSVKGAVGAARTLIRCGVSELTYHTILIVARKK